jgi:hypothetical protein
MLRYLNRFLLMRLHLEMRACIRRLWRPRPDSSHWLCEKLQSWLHVDSLSTAADIKQLDLTHSFRFAMTLQHINES